MQRGVSADARLATLRRAILKARSSSGSPQRDTLWTRRWRWTTAALVATLVFQALCMVTSSWNQAPVFGWTAEFHTTRLLFCELLCAVLVVAFVSLGVQVRGLVGTHGIMPITDTVCSLRRRVGLVEMLAATDRSDTAPPPVSLSLLVCALSHLFLGHNDPATPAQLARGHVMDIRGDLNRRLEWLCFGCAAVALAVAVLVATQGLGKFSVCSYLLPALLAAQWLRKHRHVAVQPERRDDALLPAWWVSVPPLLAGACNAIVDTSRAVTQLWRESVGSPPQEKERNTKEAEDDNHGTPAVSDDEGLRAVFQQSVALLGHGVAWLCRALCQQGHADPSSPTASTPWVARVARAATHSALVWGPVALSLLAFVADLSATVSDLNDEAPSARESTSVLLYTAGTLWRCVCALLLYAVPAAFLGMYVVYASFTNAMSPFLNLQWDCLVCELCIFAALASVGGLDCVSLAAVALLGQLLLFKLIFSSAVVKIMSGCPTWRDGSALTVHFETQPLVHSMSWLAHRLPRRLLVWGTYGTLVAEGPVALLAFLPVVGGHFVAWLTNAILMCSIVATGHYGFFNLLTLALNVWLLDDRWLCWLGVPHRIAGGGVAFGGEESTVFGASWTSACGLVVQVVLVWAFVVFCVAINMATMCKLSRGYIEPFPWAARWLNAVKALRLCHPYGLFARMRTTRHELDIQGSDDRRVWKSYQLKYKPSSTLPCLVAPTWCLPGHMPRLDWRVWFLSSARTRGTRPWFTCFLKALLKGHADVLRLLHHNPFPEQPPTWIRVRFFDASFAESTPTRHILHYALRGPQQDITGSAMAVKRRQEEWPDSSDEGSSDDDSDSDSEWVGGDAEAIAQRKRTRRARLSFHSLGVPARDTVASQPQEAPTSTTTPPTARTASKEPQGSVSTHAGIVTPAGNVLWRFRYRRLLVRPFRL